MRVRTMMGPLAAGALLLAASPLFAQTKAENKAETAAAGEPRKDPAGVTGISPYMEAISKGEKAFVARDFPGALEAFQEAIKLDPEKMLGFYRMAETDLAAGKLEGAEGSLLAALSKKGPPALHAKVLFGIADLRERQMRLQDAKEAWSEYAKFLEASEKAGGFPATATERQKQADRRMKDEKDGAVVKERIAARQAEQEKAAADNAAKDKLNR